MEAVEEGGFFSRMWDFVMMKFHTWFGVGSKLVGDYSPPLPGRGSAPTARPQYINFTCCAFACATIFIRSAIADDGVNPTVPILAARTLPNLL
jgi:hypothetical protein